MTDVNLLRAQMPTGSNRTIRFKIDPERSYSRVGEIYCTIVEHDRDGVYVGAHPDLFRFPYDAIVEVVR
jgi:hypothetical protein